MKKSWLAILAACVLVVGCLGAVATMNGVLVAVQLPYPGANRVRAQLVDPVMLGSGSLSRLSVYQTPDARTVVTRWYARRLHVSPASTTLLTGADCSQVSQSEMVIWIGHSVVVNICEIEGGTQIMVNGKLSLWP